MREAEAIGSVKVRRLKVWWEVREVWERNRNTPTQTHTHADQIRLTDEM